MKKRFLLAGLVLGGGLAVQAMSLTESTFTEVIKDVNVVSQATKAAQPARVKDIVKAPDLVRTGPDSRAELTAPDQTIDRKSTRLNSSHLGISYAVFCLNPAPTEIYTLSLHDALPIWVKDIVKAPDLVRTGPDSRAELTAPDQT